MLSYLTNQIPFLIVDGGICNFHRMVNLRKFAGLKLNVNNRPDDLNYLTLVHDELLLLHHYVESFILKCSI
jgi:hypothetical protein